MSETRLPERLGLALVGYRGTGKSTVGRLLAERLGRPFVDADVYLELRMGRSIRSVFEDLGEPAFRDREETALAELTAETRKVIATGGGVVLRSSNRAALRRFGFVVWLKAHPSTLAERLQTDSDRPPLTTAGTIGEIAEVLAAREALYREVADAVADTDGRTPEQVADAVIARLPCG